MHVTLHTRVLSDTKEILTFPKAHFFLDRSHFLLFYQM